jgi:hypothetical protein
MAMSVKSSHARFIFVNKSDTAILTANPAPAAGRTIEALQSQSGSNLFYSLSAANQVISGNFDSPLSIVDAGAALIGRMSSAATVRLQLFSGINCNGTLLYDTLWLAVSPRGKQWSIFFQGSGNSLSFRLELSDPAPPDGYHVLNRLVIGETFCAKINIVHNYIADIDDDTIHVLDAGGGILPDIGPQRKRFSFTLPSLTDDERARLESALTFVGKWRDIFCSLRPSNAYSYDFEILALFTRIPGQSPSGFLSWAAQFEVVQSSGGWVIPKLSSSVSQAGGAGIGGTWELALNGVAPVTSAQPIASNGAGVSIIVYQGRTLMRTVDHGLTWLPVEISSCPSKITDITWSGNYFLAAGDSGDVYQSADGVSWSQEHQLAAPMGEQIDIAIAWDDGFYATAGAKMRIGFVGGVISDESAASGWGLLEHPIGAAIARTGVNSGLLFPAHSGLVIAQYAAGGWSYWEATGAAGNWVRAFAAWDGRVAALCDDGVLYRSDDGGHTFTPVYPPPDGYIVHDIIVIAGPVLVLSMAGPGADRMLVVSSTFEVGSFTELRISAPVRSAQYSRLAFTGRRAIITDAGAVWVSCAI